MNIFEVATKNKFRFQFKGTLTVEDLWDLPIKDLDSLYRHLHSQQKECEESLLEVKSVKDLELETKINIIKYIVNSKIEDRKEAEAKLVNKQKKELIERELKERELNDLKNLSKDELIARLKELK